jgi:hypothetical protein
MPERRGDPDQQPAPDEQEVLKTLTLLAAESRVYRMHLENASAVIERLSTDLDDVTVAMLWTSVTAALAQPPELGTPRHIEKYALQVLRELDGTL